MKQEFKRIKDVCRKIIGEESYKRVKKLEGYAHRTEGLKYLVDSKFKLILLELESKLEGVDKKDSLILESKIRRLSAKIKIFQSTYSNRDYEVLQKLIKEIEEEIKNVGPV